MSLGHRWGYVDDGQTANCQLAFHPYEPVPLLMDMFGLPMKNMDKKTGEPPYKGIRTGNIIHCEGGYVAESKAYDNEGKTITKFENFLTGPDHMKNFIDSVRAGKYTKDVLHIRHGQQAAALAHLANISYRLGKAMKNEEIKERLQGDKFGQEMFAGMLATLAANQINTEVEQVVVGPWLDFDPVNEVFTGEFAAEANKLAQEEYAAGFELPEV